VVIIPADEHNRSALINYCTWYRVNNIGDKSTQVNFSHKMPAVYVSHYKEKVHK